MGGVDPVWFLTSDDEIAVRSAQLAVSRRMELEHRRDENRAVLIANAVGKMLGG